MKTLKRLDEYLKKNYPMIWNTKIVWVLFAGFWVHLLFFIIGYFSMNDNMLKEANLNIYNRSFVVIISVLFSIIILLIWFINYFKNNGFKSFYPKSKASLFGELLILFVGIYFSISFMFSYINGMRCKLDVAYPEEEISKQIDLANEVYFLLPYNIYDFTIDRKSEPSYFHHLECHKISEHEDYIDIHQPSISDGVNTFQFYSIKDLGSVYTLSAKEDWDINYEYNYKHDSLESIFMKKYGNYYNSLVAKQREVHLYIIDSIYDISGHLETVKPSLYHGTGNTLSNIKERTFRKENYIGIKSTYTPGDSLIPHLAKTQYAYLQNKNGGYFLEKMKEFIKLSDSYKNERNIEVEDWYNMVYRPEKDYRIDTQLFQNIYKDIYGKIRYDGVTYKPFEIVRAYENKQSVNSVTNDNRNHIYPFYNSDKFLNSASLENIFENIYELRHGDQKSDTFILFIFISSCLALLIFMFRISDIKTIIFTGIGLSLLFILFGLLMAIIRIGNIGLIIALLILAAVIISGLFFNYNGRKFLKGILIQLTLIAFPMFLFTIYFEYERIQKGLESMYYELNMNSLVSIIVVLSLVFYYFYMKKILAWKAMPR